MELRIQALHFDITAKLEDFIAKKADKLQRRNPAVTYIDFTLKVVKPETSMNKNVLVLVNVPQSEDIVAEKTADTFEEAIDLALEAIERQLQKFKEKK